MTITLDIKNLSEEIHLAVKTIRSTLVNNPQALPPRLVIPGQKRLLWLRTDVVEFYQRQAKGHGSNPAFSTAQPEKLPEPIEKKRGRPTKAQELAKAALKAASKA